MRTKEWKKLVLLVRITPSKTLNVTQVSIPKVNNFDLLKIEGGRWRKKERAW